RTEISTKVLYLGRATLDVRFPRFNSALRFDPDNLGTTRAEIAVATGAVQTDFGFITPMIRSSDFLDTRTHPELRFRLTKLTKTSQSTADIQGNITMLGVTRPLALKATVFKYGPSDRDPNVTEAGFTLRGSLDRRDFGNNTGYPEIAAELPLEIQLFLTTAPET
ncbi:MAG: YceI family protein, partial [Pseudomonadota bacterium]